MSTDFTLVDHGSIAIISPVSDEAICWAEHFISDDATWFGDGFVVEHRYVDDIIARLIELDMEIRPILISQVMH